MYKASIRSNELYHFGVKGMKWYQHIFGDYQSGAKYSKYTGKTETIPAGSQLYRVTVNKNEPTSGNKYMTYFQSDRDFYRGQGANWIASVNNKKPTELHEKTYTTTTDVKLPSTDKMYDTIKKVVIDDAKKKTEAGKALADFYLTNQGLDSKSVKFSTAYNKEIKSGQKAAQKYLKDQGSQLEYEFMYKPKVDKAINAMSGKEKQDAIMAASAGFGTPRGSKLKEKVITELKKEGYNGMTDYAGVGGHMGWRREARQTLVIFDTDKVLKESSSTSINTITAQRATYNYDKWYRNARKEDLKKRRVYEKNKG